MNFFISIVGWALWNWAQLTIEKKMLDDDGDVQTNFNIRDYSKKQWVYWVGSLLCIPVILWIGYTKLSIDPLASLIGIESKLGWHDLYLLGSGAAFEAVIFVVIVIRKYFKSKQ